MSRQDLKRYIEQQVPNLGEVANDPSALLCFNDDCEESVEVDPGTLVVEDADAVELVSEIGKPDPTTPPDRKRVEVYCSPECRNQRYGVGRDE